MDLCGEENGRRYTIKATDHAAIKLDAMICRSRSFFPFEILSSWPFFPDYCVVVCNSGEQAEERKRQADVQPQSPRLCRRVS